MRLHLQLPSKAGGFRISACEAERLVMWPANAFQIFLERPWGQKNLASKTDCLTEDNGVAALLLEKLRESPETAEAILTGESFDVRFHPEFCKNLLDWIQLTPAEKDARKEDYIFA